MNTSAETSKNTAVSPKDAQNDSSVTRKGDIDDYIFSFQPHCGGPSQR
ncbi:MAG: hypothetical protein IJL87_06470 [Clostridia bacterium]|nr:hypothetical protein [Clostridia bacterium]